MLADAVKRGMDEQYECATTTSDLTVSVHRRGAADILTASGWSQRMAGGALLRLHTQWVSAKPRRITEEMVDAHAADLPRRKERPDMRRARADLLDAYLTMIRERAGRLYGRAGVVEHLKAWAAEHQVDPAIVDATLTYWLAPQCPLCDGLGKRRLPDAPVLGISCSACQQSGKLTRPFGAAKLLQYIDDAIQAHRESLKRRLRG
jgi:hypothetical protein